LTTAASGLRRSVVRWRENPGHPQQVRRGSNTSSVERIQATEENIELASAGAVSRARRVGDRLHGTAPPVEDADTVTVPATG
jgi:hypothetical protein